ncbi:MAG: hypothetical protein LM549_05215, partial [Candidatus Competibacter sp.]|nr:hypothetical protein [Candidatus Competibacter sp.]
EGGFASSAYSVISRSTAIGSNDSGFFVRSQRMSVNIEGPHHCWSVQELHQKHMWRDRVPKFFPRAALNRSSRSQGQ